MRRILNQQVYAGEMHCGITPGLRRSHRSSQAALPSVPFHLEKISVFLCGGKRGVIAMMVYFFLTVVLSGGTILL